MMNNIEIALEKENLWMHKLKKALDKTEEGLKQYNDVMAEKGKKLIGKFELVDLDK